MFQLVRRNKLRSVEEKAEVLSEALSMVAFAVKRPEEIDASITLSEEMAAGIERVVTMCGWRERSAIVARTQALLRERIRAPQLAAARAWKQAREAEEKRLEERATALAAMCGAILVGELEEWVRAPGDRAETRVFAVSGAPLAADRFPEPSPRQLQEMALRARARLWEEHTLRCDTETIELALARLQEQRLAAQRNMSIDALRAAKAAALEEERS